MIKTVKINCITPRINVGKRANFNRQLFSRSVTWEGYYLEITHLTIGMIVIDC